MIILYILCNSIMNQWIELPSSSSLLLALASVISLTTGFKRPSNTLWCSFRNSSKSRYYKWKYSIIVMTHTHTHTHALHIYVHRRTHTCISMHLHIQKSTHIHIQCSAHTGWHWSGITTTQHELATSQMS